MDRKRNHLAAALVAVLTAAAIFEVYYFGFQLPGEEARERQKLQELIAKPRKERAAIEQQVAAQAVGSKTANENK
ncbi:MAG: hypothetical protein ABJB22_03380 [Verrucomicrobiota bacterium]